MSRNSTVGLSRKQTVFATLESTLGVLQFPNATFDHIRPAGNTTLNQKPAFVNSEEIRDSLDILDQFQNATPPGEFTLKMYVRPSGTLGTASAPQGSVLFRSLQGMVAGAISATLSAGISATATSISLISLDGVLPHTGVLSIGSEKVGYTGLVQSSSKATWTLTGVTRGYGTNATSHSTSATIGLASLFYRQQATSPSFSLWVGTDHFVQAMAGCSINSATLDVTNEGGLAMTFTGQGVRMYWAGTDSLATNATAGATSITVQNAKLFTPSMYIYNKTKNSEKKLISASNATTNTITLANACGAAWATGDVISGYLPSGTVIGNAIEAKDSQIYLNSIATTIKRGTLNIGTPKQYLIDEVGTAYPTDYLENVRDINSNLSIYFRKSDAKLFKEGYDGNEVPIRLVFGDTPGYIMEMYMPRCKLQVPEISFTPPAVELAIPMTALGTEGEDSLEIVFK